MFNRTTNVQDADGNTQLHRAILRREFEEVERLILQEDADPNIQNVHGQLPIHLVIDMNEDDLENEELNILFLLLFRSRMDDLDDILNQQDFFLFEPGVIVTFRNSLAYAGQCNIEFADQNGETPLRLGFAKWNVLWSLLLAGVRLDNLDGLEGTNVSFMVASLFRALDQNPENPQLVAATFFREMLMTLETEDLLYDTGSVALELIVREKLLDPATLHQYLINPPDHTGNVLFRLLKLFIMLEPNSDGGYSEELGELREILITTTPLFEAIGHIIHDPNEKQQSIIQMNESLESFFDWLYEYLLELVYDSDEERPFAVDAAESLLFSFRNNFPPIFLLEKIRDWIHANAEVNAPFAHGFNLTHDVQAGNFITELLTDDRLSLNTLFSHIQENAWTPYYEDKDLFPRWIEVVEQLGLFGHEQFAQTNMTQLIILITFCHDQIDEIPDLIAHILGILQLDHDECFDILRALTSFPCPINYRDQYMRVFELLSNHLPAELQAEVRPNVLRYPDYDEYSDPELMPEELDAIEELPRRPANFHTAFFALPDPTGTPNPIQTQAPSP